VRASGGTFETFCSVTISYIGVVSIACNKIRRLLFFKSADINYKECVQSVVLVCYSFSILLLIYLLYQVKKLYKVLLY
jgi:hypothetical protein